MVVPEKEVFAVRLLVINKKFELFCVKPPAQLISPLIVTIFGVILVSNAFSTPVPDKI